MRLRVHSNSEEIKFMRAMAYIIEVNKEKKKGTNVLQGSVNGPIQTSWSVTIQDLS